MSLKENSPENLRQPRGIMMKFAAWCVLYIVVMLILNLSAGVIGFGSPVEILVPLLIAGGVAFLSRPGSQQVAFKNKDKFIEGVKKSLPKNYNLALQTQTLLYFKPASILGKVFNDVILVDIQGETATLTGEISVVNRLRQELKKAGVIASA